MDKGTDPNLNKRKTYLADLKKVEDEMDQLVEWLTDADINDVIHADKLNRLHQLEVRYRKLTEPTISDAKMAGIEEVSIRNLTNL